MRTSMPAPKILLAACLGAVLILPGCGGSGGEPATEVLSSSAAAAPGASSAGTSMRNEADVMFAQMMIPHHREAVEMAELASTRSAGAEVKELADNIKAAQQPEIDAMSGWLQEWGEKVPAPGEDMSAMGHSMPGDMSEADMAALRAASGADFDKQFLTMMIAHHEGAIQMADEHLASGANDAAKTLSRAILTTQQAEIVTMKGMLAR